MEPNKNNRKRKNMEPRNGHVQWNFSTFETNFDVGFWGFCGCQSLLRTHSVVFDGTVLHITTPGGHEPKTFGLKYSIHQNPLPSYLHQFWIDPQKTGPGDMCYTHVLQRCTIDFSIEALVMFSSSSPVPSRKSQLQASSGREVIIGALEDRKITDE